MDTNQALNYLINAFTKGMNSDTSLDVVSNEQYLFGLNIRITNNVNIGNDILPNNKEGIVVPIQEPSKFDISLDYDKILATDSIGNIGVIVFSKGSTWSIMRVEKTDEGFDTKILFTADEAPEREKFSIVMNKELENLIKLYVADGKHEVMLFDLNETYEDFTIDQVVSNHLFPSNKVVICGTIQGQLKTSQVQYTYRLYKRRGIVSKLSPLTNKILIIDNNRDKEIGNAKNTVTSIGLKLKIDIPDDLKGVFDSVQLYRLSYVEEHSNAEVDLIYDAKFDKNAESITIEDNGIKSLQSLSMDEFTSMNGQDVIPKVIEHTQGYLFGANVKDVTIKRDNIDYTAISGHIDENGNYEDCDDQHNDINTIYNIKDTQFRESHVDQDENIYVGGYGDNVSWKLVQIEVPLHEDFSLDGLKFYSLVYDKETNSIKPSDGTGVNDIGSVNGIFEEDFNISIDNTENLNYNNIFISSALRSLRRGETYRYGIIFYDEFGRRTDVNWIADIKIPETSILPFYCKRSDGEYIFPLGISFDIKKPDGYKGYEIVRCAKTPQHSRILLQCALSRPVRQPKVNEKNTLSSPYYPNMIITSDRIQIISTESTTCGPAFGDINSLYLIFASEILYKRNDYLNNLQSISLQFNPLYYLRPSTNDTAKLFNENYNFYYSSLYITHDYITLVRNELKFDPLEKNITSVSLDYNDIKWFSDEIFENKNTEPIDIQIIKDVKNPTWEQGFTNIQNNSTDSKITSGIKQYKSYLTSIRNKQYVNWISNGIYDLSISESEANNITKGWNPDNDDFNAELTPPGILISYHTRHRIFTDSVLKYEQKPKGAYGLIGPGPMCFIAATKEPAKNSIFSQSIITSPSDGEKHAESPGTIISNIIHEASLFSGTTEEERQYDTYYGFGNYINFGNGEYKNNVVFDGDIYITPCEFVSMFKAYDFRSIDDTLPSTQVICKMVMESKVNTLFDYGMNYSNTNNPNLQLEPGNITGIASQDRPLHQYNSIYSDNDISNNVFAAKSLNDSESQFSSRIVYSQHKDNGEEIDNWSIFKPIDYIDADGRYGNITEMLSVRDVIYYWQEHAFGKLSVNERSLVTDNNNNTIQLGQGGVLQRTDYINTNYGMRECDYSAINTENGIFWIDILNKAILGFGDGAVVNYGERLNVQNIINSNISNNIPVISYDIQNDELLCKCFNNDQLVFNTKLNCASSVYTRSYDDMIEINNILYGIDKQLLNQYNYLNGTNNEYCDTELKFVVNNAPSLTKVFDNQKIVLIGNQKDYENNEYLFTTDLNSTTVCKIKNTDREGNICYCIPRFEGSAYGNRLRGKWMTVDIKDTNKTAYGISHIITKFRQSYS